MKLFATSFAVVFSGDKPTSFLPVVSRKPGKAGVEVFRSADEVSIYLQSLVSANEGATSAAVNLHTSEEGCRTQGEEFFRVSYHAPEVAAVSPNGGEASGLFDAGSETPGESAEKPASRRRGSVEDTV